MRNILLLYLMLLASCSVIPEEQKTKLSPARPIPNIIAGTVTGTVKGAWNIAQTPFEDVGIKKKPIPEKLKQIMDNPYFIADEASCEDIIKEIGELDSILGADIYAPQNIAISKSVHKGEYIEQGAKMAQEHAIGIVGDKVNIIPFRGVVRKVSGAEKHARLVEKAYNAGNIRRAFLKGVLAENSEECAE